MSYTTMTSSYNLPTLATSSKLRSFSSRGQVPNKAMSTRSSVHGAGRFVVRADGSSESSPEAQRAESIAASPVYTTYTDLMAFGGVAPELINGRVCMGAFVAAVGAELATHETVAQQFADAPLASAAFFSVIYFASFMPHLRGQDMNPANDYGQFWQRYPTPFQKIETTPGAMTIEEHAQLNSPYTTPSTIEMWNGRAAMIGLVALFATEAMTHSAMF